MKIPGFLLCHNVSIKEYSGSGAYGPIWDTEYIVKGYFETNIRLVRDGYGEEVVSGASVIMGPETCPEPKSIVTFEGIEHEVILSKKFYDPLQRGKAHHVEVFLK